ncbi:PhoH family protein [Cupriavidus sp. RAF12]|uniref:PhoH family protein n=1 Tax=Cupriavidus sp. RAF12 TaxID=3233050 RepID=UPI003F903897
MGKPRFKDPAEVELLADYAVRGNNQPLEPRNPRQRKFLNAVRNTPLTFGLGPAGTGKTFLSAALALEALAAKTVDRIVITRPMVEAEEHIGFLPGSADEKFAPYFTPFREALEERVGSGHVQALLKTRRIEMAPLALMRGRSFKRCFVVLDEAQNTTVGQMRLFLTRLGEDVKVIVNGDLDQIDIKVPSGLKDAFARLRPRDSASVAFVHYGPQDVVRSALCQEMVEAYAA